MTTWGVVNLSGASSWAPVGLLPSLQPRAAPATFAGATVRLEELVEIMSPKSAVRSGERLVTPAGTCSTTGAVQPSERVSAGVTHRLGEGLRPGDILLPSVGSGPCILVESRHQRLAFSRAFLALRPRQANHSVLLWALLSSDSGISARHFLDRGSLVPSLRAGNVGDLLVPSPSERTRDPTVLLPEPPVDEVAAAILIGSWKVISLQGASDWSPARMLAPPAPDGAVLAELGAVFAGRLEARNYADQPFVGAVPAFRPSDIGRLATPRWWAEAPDASIAEPGSVLLGALSLRVAIAEERVGVAKDVLVFHANPRPPFSAFEVRDRVFAYLSSAAGQKRLREHAAGSISRMFLRSYKAFTVPSLETLSSLAPASGELLSSRLERLLWS